MKILTVDYGVSVLLGEAWEKINVHGKLEKGDTMESALDDLNGRLRIWHQKTHPSLYANGKVPLFITSKVEEEVFADQKEWESVKQVLESFPYQEDAQVYLETTAYRMVVEAKKIVLSKPNKPTTDVKVNVNKESNGAAISKPRRNKANK